MPESNRNEVKYTNCTNIEYSVANGAEYLEFNGVRDGSIESMRWTINLHWTESIGIEEGDPPEGDHHRLPRRDGAGRRPAPHVG